MLKIQQSTLKNDCLTRWGSTYEMLLSVKQQEQSVCAVLLETTRRDLMLSSGDLAVVEELLLVLKPFDDATEIVGGEKYPTISIIAPLLHKFINITLKEEESDSPITKEVKEAIREDLTTRYQSDEIQIMLNMAMFLDPRFKSLSFLKETEKAVILSHLKSALTEQIEKVKEENQNGVVSNEDSMVVPSPKKKKLDTLLADIFDTSGLENDNVDIEEIAIAEIKRYEAEEVKRAQLSDVEPLQWWKQRVATYSYLSKLATKILSVTATSVPSERLFSSAGNLVSNKRSCLLPANVDRLLFLYENLPRVL